MWSSGGHLLFVPVVALAEVDVIVEKVNFIARCLKIVNLDEVVPRYLKG
jgi:hypothetical protein